MYLAGTGIVPPIPVGSRHLLCSHTCFLCLLYHMGGGADHLSEKNLFTWNFYKHFSHMSLENGVNQNHPKFILG